MFLAQNKRQLAGAQTMTLFCRLTAAARHFPDAGIHASRRQASRRPPVPKGWGVSSSSLKKGSTGEIWVSP
jgi:hypothetical protein